MNNTTPRNCFTCLIVAFFLFGSPFVIASPVFSWTETPSNESIYGDCIVQDVAWKQKVEFPANEFDWSEGNSTEMNCESGNRSITVSIDNEKPDRIWIGVYLDKDFDNSKPVLKAATAPSLFGSITEEKSDFLSNRVRQVIVNGEIEFRFSGSNQVKVKVSSKETYKPNDILNDLAENGELKLEFEINAHTHEKTVEFDGANNAAKEFLKRVKSLQETSNQNR
ncbi:MAG: hypothetical protein OXH84_00300 [Gammaproteobacteria bacterium]|nr:hypothetical protein [Gammaproteobacteria bacterium]